MQATILDLAKACPDAIVAIKVSDLVEANEALIQKTKCELEELVTDQHAETYPSRQKVAEILDVDLTTLHRWAQRGILVPLSIGGKRRYKMSEVRRLLEHPEEAHIRVKPKRQ